MGNQSKTKFTGPWLAEIFKSVLVAGVILVILHHTGVISAASTATQWTLLQSGVRDADEAETEDKQDFDYNFTIKDLEGNRVPFETFKGKVIFLNLWATWCGPCRVEMPGIQALYDKVDKEKIVFVMLSLDSDENLPKVSNYLKVKSFTFKAYLPSGELPKLLQVPGIPTTFVISPDGKVMKKEVGSMQYDTPEFKKFLEKLAE